MTAARSFAAWSCTMRVVVDHDAAADAACRDLQDFCAEVDRLVSRFRDDSELSALNARAGRPVAISRSLLGFLTVALEAARSTDGALDPTIGADLIRWGYDRDIALVRDAVDAVDADGAAAPRAGGRRRHTWRTVRLDRERGLLQVPRGVALDLGATAKAHAADLAAARLHRTHGGAVYVELGGDVAVAGRRSGGWPIAVAERPGGEGELVTLGAHGRAGLATSTTTIRRWWRGGCAANHVIDPATGTPVAGPWRTVSVAAGPALTANVASTAALVRGADAPRRLAEAGLAARLVHRDGTVRHVGPWPRQRAAA